ncbi:heterokaryon incompatibility protein-domain-containing protein [Alternaria rosae]|uniref:heterokaryon incompatibility protein-domain-containing protein n=1 Tax=Alternaria rosae TaxID=1187941 RepID=UPI001E8E80EB|nr:heterokaryon incompatibility protein-domain-containing protein [Alternaria rosae]KAH6858912.1 heterokaryon incompatibility protein-domain-containing protein [Alternaria rosae]
MPSNRIGRNHPDEPRVTHYYVEESDPESDSDSWSSESDSDEWSSESDSDESSSESDSESEYYITRPRRDERASYQVYTERPSRHYRKPRTSREYEYKPLKDAECYTRLLTVLPLRRNIIECELRRVLKKQAYREGYRALSYEWGDSERDKRAIYIDGKLHEVTKNLHRFLQHAAVARMEGTPGWNSGVYWIDALCIDQKDEKEKLTQLKHIRNIYSCAYETLAWLGSGPSYVASAVGLLGNLRESIHRGPESEEDAVNRWAQIIRRRPDAINEKQISALKTILDCQYWTRLWIVQEIVASDQMRSAFGRERVRLICGRSECPWSFFMCLPLVIQLHPSQSLTAKALMTRIKETQRIWLLFQLATGSLRVLTSSQGGRRHFETKQLPLPLLIHLTENSAATRGEDYVYALLGLADGRSRHRIKPENNLTGCELLTQLMRRMLKSQEKLTDPDERDEYKAMARMARRALHRPLDNSERTFRERRECCGTYCESSNSTKLGEGKSAYTRFWARME